MKERQVIECKGCLSADTLMGFLLDVSIWIYQEAIQMHFWWFDLDNLNWIEELNWTN